MRYASRLQHYLDVNNYIFSSSVRAFYKNTQIFTTAKLEELDQLNGDAPGGTPAPVEVPRSRPRNGQSSS